MRALFEDGTLTGLTDGQLLERFTLGKRELAEAAFMLLVQRHGPMVLRVCQQVLGDPHEAEDVFQATFLVLARKAGSIRREGAVASWVYGVARRLSLRSRRLAARRRELERKRLLRSERTEPASVSPPEQWPELYEELDRLPQPFRAAVVLCDLEGNTYEQAAGMLHCPIGTVQSRLFRGRQRLRQRLERRGLGSALALSGGRLPLASPPGVPKPLTASLAHSAASISQGQPIGGSISATVVALLASEVKREVLRRCFTASISVVVAGLMVAGAAGLMMGQRDGTARSRDAVADPKAKLRAVPINIRVVGIQGRPVPGAMVHAVEFASHAPIQNFTTDLHGLVEIPRVGADQNSQLLARGPDGSLAWAQVGYGQPDDQPAGTQADPLIMKLVPLGHLAQGSVVDQTGQPIAGAEVMAQGFQALFGDWVAFTFRSEDLPLPQVVSDQAGRFTISLPSGAQANLHVRHARFLGQWKVIGADAKPAEPFVLEPAGGIAGRVIDAAGRPVAKALVSAQLTESRARFLGGGWGEVQSDDQGRFAITNLEPGVFNLLFEEVPGWPTATARAVEGLRVRAGSNTAALMKVIQGRPLRGIVIDKATDEPVVGIDVGCYGPARPRSGAAVDSRKTDATGRFTFQVPPGEHDVYLMDGISFSRLSRGTIDVPEEGEIAPVRLIRIGQSANSRSSQYVTKAAIRPSETTKGEAKPKEKRDVAENKEVKAAAIRTLTGRVRGPQGEPLAGIQVMVNTGMQAPNAEPEQFDTAVTDREGVFILSGLPRCLLQISLSRQGFQYQTESVPADKDEIECKYQLKPISSSRFRKTPRQDDPVPPELRQRLTFIDLSPRCDELLSDGPGAPGGDLGCMIRGVRKTEDLYFRIGETMAHVQGQMRANLPTQIKGIEVHGRGGLLHLLHATQMGVAAGTEIGAYVVHYADKSTERIPIVYGRDIVSWFLWDRPGFRDLPTSARVVWTGSNDITEANRGLKLRLVAQTWTNPHPEKEIATLDVVSGNTLCEPFLVAATLEKTE